MTPTLRTSCKKVKFLDLCERCCHKPEDYTKEKVKQHNKATRELFALSKEISQDQELATGVFAVLLQSEDAFVRTTAAAHCLKYGFHEQQAEKLLEKTSKGKDKMAAFSAEMTLSVWRGEVPGKTL